MFEIFLFSKREIKIKEIDHQIKDVKLLEFYKSYFVYKGLVETWARIVNQLDCDYAIKPANWKVSLVVFDLESTLIQEECLNILAEEMGVTDQVSEITRSSMRGEIDFKGSFKRRIKLVKGLELDALINLEYNFNQGAKEICEILKKEKIRFGIVSGGLKQICDRVAQEIKADFVYSNEIEFVHGHSTGNVIGDILGPQEKADILKQERISKGLTLAIGDGANDILMIKEADIGIAFKAKPILETHANSSFRTVPLDFIKFLL